jgi:hypothetical protein
MRESRGRERLESKIRTRGETPPADDYRRLAAGLQHPAAHGAAGGGPAAPVAAIAAQPAVGDGRKAGAVPSLLPPSGCTSAARPWVAKLERASRPRPGEGALGGRGKPSGCPPAPLPSAREVALLSDSWWHGCPWKGEGDRFPGPLGFGPAVKPRSQEGGAAVRNIRLGVPVRERTLVGGTPEGRSAIA